MQSLTLILTLMQPPVWTITETSSPGFVVTETQQSEVASESGCYLVVFTTSSCSPCQSWKRTHLPRIEALGHKVRIIDVDRDSMWRVTTVPTFWVVDRATKKVVRTFVGIATAETLLPMLKVKSQQSSEDSKHIRAETEVPAPAQKQGTVSLRISHSEMVRLHNQLHGGGSWTWPGDLATHLSTVHGVAIDR